MKVRYKDKIELKPIFDAKIIAILHAFCFVLGEILDVKVQMSNFIMHRRKSSYLLHLKFQMSNFKGGKPMYTYTYEYT